MSLWRGASRGWTHRPLHIHCDCCRENLVCVQEMLARSEEERRRVTSELDRARRSAGGALLQEARSAPGAPAVEVILTGTIMRCLCCCSSAQNEAQPGEYFGTYVS